MKESAPGKSLWEYILLAVSAMATLVQVLGLISQSQALFAQPSITATFVVIVLIGTTIGCIFVLIRKKTGTFTAKVPYYTGRQRAIAGGLLVTNLLVSMLVLGFIIWRPCPTSREPIPSGKFGILVADFTEGPNRSPTLKGEELAQRTLDALNVRLVTTPLANKVVVRRFCVITNADEAQRAGKSANAKLVLWGNAAEFTQDAFTPSFTFVDPLLWPSDVDPWLFNVELNRVDSIDLPSKISARTTSIASFVVGLIYLREGKNTQDYKFALREFKSAIEDTEPELANLVKGSPQDSAVKRTLAIFHVLRGRVYAALNDNQSAFADYSSAQSYDPYYPSIYVAQGNYFYALREFSQAKQQYEKAISIWQSASAYYGLANTLFYLHHYPESKDSYLKAISLIESKGEDAAGTRIVLAVVSSLTGETQRALDELNKVVQSDKSSQLEKKQAQKLIESILNQASSPTTASITPTVAAINTAAPSPVNTLMMTLIINSNTPTRRPSIVSNATQFATPASQPTMLPPRITETPIVSPIASITPTLLPTFPETPTQMLVSPTVSKTPSMFPTPGSSTPTLTLYPTVVVTPSPMVSTMTPYADTSLTIYDWNSKSIIGYMSCSEVYRYSWNLDILPDSGAVIYYSTVQLYGSVYAGFYLLDAQMICGR